MSTGKTIREWLEGLPEPHRTQALANMGVNKGPGTAVYPNAMGAVSEAFSWAKSPEGFDYWANFVNKSGKQEKLS